jgi:hypothetical protein
MIRTDVSHARPAGTLVLARPPVLPPPKAALDLLAGGSMRAVTITERVVYRVPLCPAGC